MKRAVTELQKRSPDTTFICLSNSNEIYIDTILKVSICHGLSSFGVLQRIHDVLTAAFFPGRYRSITV